MRKRKLTEERLSALERERTEWVLRLEPGTLDRVEGFGLSYDGTPEWVEKDLQDAHGWDATFCTVVTDGGGYQCAPSEKIVDSAGQEWVLVGSWSHGAETECPVPENHPGKVSRDECILVDDPYRHSKGYGPKCGAVRAECPMCEARLGAEHEYIYVGEGYEATYKLVEADKEEREECEG